MLIILMQIVTEAEDLKLDPPTQVKDPVLIWENNENLIG